MNKIQKIWLWVSMVMFLVPEIFFSPIISFFASLSGITNFPFLYKYFIDLNFFSDNPIYLFIILSIEFLGALGLLIWNVKFNHYKYKIFLTVIITLIIFTLLLLFFVGYSVTNMSFP